MKRLLFALLVITIVFMSVGPFLWFVDTSFKTAKEVTSIPPKLIPSWSVGFYFSAIKRYRLLHYLKNSFFVAGGTTVLTIVLAVLCGYAVARLRLPGKELFMKLLLLVSMFPQISIAGPVWRIMYKLNWLNTYQGLILPYVTLTLPLGVWVVASFFIKLPPDLEDAARVDGCSHIKTLLKIILPLSAPGVFTAAILVFIYAWNEFFFALLIMTRQDVQTLPVGIAMFQGQYTLPWGEIAAASTVATLPLVLMVLVFQRRIISGLSAGAIKG